MRRLTAVLLVLTVGALAWAQCFCPGGASQLGQTITSYNGIAKDTNHNGIGFIGWSATATAQGANIAATTLVTPTVAGRFRLCGYVAVTRQATTSSTVPNIALTCTDPTDSLAKTVDITFAIQNIAANPGTTVAHGGCGICDAKVSTAVQYSTTDYASTGATSMQYKLYVTLEAL